MLLHVDPRLKFNIDLGWAMVAGLDPVKLLKRLEGRIANVHLKDFYDLEAPKHILNSDPSTKVGFYQPGQRAASRRSDPGGDGPAGLIIRLCGTGCAAAFRPGSDFNGVVSAHERKRICEMIHVK